MALPTLLLALVACGPESLNPLGSNNTTGTDNNNNTVDPNADADGDGHLAGNDCDDSDPQLYKKLDGYSDADGDGYTVGELLEGICSGDELPSGYQAEQSNLEDCDDTHFYTNPSIEIEYLDERDNDCDGSKEIFPNTHGITLTPEYTGNVQAGSGALAIGDVDGDGIDDIVIGSPNEGMTYLVFGDPTKTAGALLELPQDADVTFKAINQGDMQLGSHIEVEDLDGDGKAEILLGASGFNNDDAVELGFGTGSNSGAIIGIAGRGRNDFLEEYNLTYSFLNSVANLNNNSIFLMEGVSNTHTGNLFTLANDIAGDGIMDEYGNDGIDGIKDFLLPHGSDRVDLVPASSAINSLYSGVVYIQNEISAYREDSSDTTTIGDMITTGDFNKDGISDLVIANANDLENQGRGRIYVEYGPIEGSLDVTNLSSQTPGWAVLEGNGTSYHAGTEVAVGDVDGDGSDDLLVTVQYEDAANYTDAGKVYVVPNYGIVDASNSATLDGKTIELNGEVHDMGGTVFQGDNSQVFLGGGGLSAESDTNGDGIKDPILASLTYFDGAGLNLFVTGGENITKFAGQDVSIADLDNDGERDNVQHYINGSLSDAYLGATIRGGGDFNGDGAQDYLVNAPNDEGGATYVLFGAPVNPE